MRIIDAVRAAQYVQSLVPLIADTKELPNAGDLAGLRHEVGLLIASMNPASAGGISS